MSSCKPFKLGLIVGRFQDPHTGHEDMINKAIMLCDRVMILVGSSQESGTEKNPFSYELRKQILTMLFCQNVSNDDDASKKAEVSENVVFEEESVMIRPLPDMGFGNNSRWGEYVLSKVVEYAGCYPDLLVTGKEERRVTWFDGIQGAQIAELSVPKTIDISASRMRAFFLADDKESWKQYTNPVLYPLYEELRDIVIASEANKETSSM